MYGAVRKRVEKPTRMLTKDYLHSKHDEFSELLKSEQFMNLIRKIRRIKAIKQEMYRFLEQRGIRPPSN